MKCCTAISVALLAGCIHLGCATAPEEGTSKSQLAVARAIVDQHGAALNALIRPYELGCMHVDEDMRGGPVCLIVITGRLPVGAVTSVRHIPYEPPVMIDTTTFSGLLRSFDAETRRSVATQFQKLEDIFVAHGFTIAETDGDAVAVWTKRPGGANKPSHHTVDSRADASAKGW